MDEEEESTDSMLITQTIDETSLLSMSPPVSPLLVETNKYDQNQRMNSLNIEDRIRNDIEDTKELEESKSIGGEDSMQITQEMSNQNMIFQHEQVLQDENEDLQSVYLSPIPETHINTEPDQTIFSSGKDEDIVQEELSKIHESAIETLMNEVNENNIPLSDFLSYVGISFPEEVPIKSLRRRSGYDINYEPATILEQTIAAASILPQVEVFQLACKQLTTLIENCKQKIQDLREDINKRNLKLFHEYAEGEIPFRSEIELGLSSYKAYARLQALCDSYHRWVTILEELRSTLKTNQEKLLENEQLITKAEEHIKEKLQDTEAYKIELQKIVDEAHSKEREYNLTDHQQLEKLENEIDQQKHSIQAFTEKAEKLEKDDIELSEKIVSLEKNKTELQEIIEKAEDIIAKNKVITLKELADASQAFNRCSKLYSWKFEKIKEDFVKVCINQDISIIIDDKKLKNKVDNAILIHTRDDLEEDFGPLVKLLHGLKTIIKDKWDINEITQDISIYWNRIKMIQYELRIIQRRFWVEIHSLDNNQLEGAGFSCKICVFNNEKQVKFTISFNIEPNDILYYPDINLSSFDLYLHHGEISYEQLRTLVVEGISETGFETLADTIENVLTQIPIP
ncbi:Spc7 kinetochore protein-domain-containing protein [Cokeromyces recurvatus]|uniref:Spc7 kinetochore protein-domain-containing protein n=1 Tax=Cokeromyces recurvatus TaxID=90255 RepID=UPI00221F1E48|nr:Spc7 kinetochore protein-domain-containing protein [Cokeromyces recurvatus]KAI7899600.1 Spc7 kinetochore protein-domain-containing protein [Cokeromyces recurvatus]